MVKFVNSRFSLDEAKQVVMPYLTSDYDPSDFDNRLNEIVVSFLFQDAISSVFKHNEYADVAAEFLHFCIANTNGLPSLERLKKLWIAGMKQAHNNTWQHLPRLPEVPLFSRLRLQDIFEVLIAIIVKARPQHGQTESAFLSALGRALAPVIDYLRPRISDGGLQFLNGFRSHIQKIVSAPTYIPMLVIQSLNVLESLVVQTDIGGRVLRDFTRGDYSVDGVDGVD